MATGLDGLAGYLKNAQLGEFKPEPFYESKTDCLIYYHRNTPSYSRRINKYLTVFLADEDDTLVGIEIKGFSIIMKAVEGLGTVAVSEPVKVDGEDGESIDLSNDLINDFQWRGAAEPSTAEVRSEQSVFLESIYRIAEEGSAQEGSVTIMQYLDDLLQSGRSDECNEILEAVQVDRLPVRMALAFCTITNLVPVDDLPAKQAMRRRVRSKLVQELGPDRAGSILPDGAL